MPLTTAVFPHEAVSALLLALAVFRSALLAIAWLTAICTKSHARRKVATYLVWLVLTPPWWRAGKKELP
jgi:hypothetical protein